MLARGLFPTLTKTGTTNDWETAPALFTAYSKAEVSHHIGSDTDTLCEKGRFLRTNQTPPGSHSWLRSSLNGNRVDHGDFVADGAWVSLTF